MSDHANLHCLREMLRRQLHAARATVARNSQTKPSRTIVKGMSYVFFSFEFHNIKFPVHNSVWCRLVCEADEWGIIES